MSDHRFDLLGLGECMVELCADGPLGSAPCLRRSFGDDVLNTLVAAARLGGRCGFISRVADDPFGPAMRQAWLAEGVDLSHAPLVRGDNGVYFISVADNGEREFSYRRRDSPTAQFMPSLSLSGACLYSATPYQTGLALVAALVDLRRVDSEATRRGRSPTGGPAQAAGRHPARTATAVRARRPIAGPDDPAVGVAQATRPRQRRGRYSQSRQPEELREAA